MLMAPIVSEMYRLNYMIEYCYNDHYISDISLLHQMVAQHTKVPPYSFQLQKLKTKDSMFVLFQEELKKPEKSSTPL